jgi:hypothetical protein
MQTLTLNRAGKPQHIPRSHRALARLTFPRQRWLHVLGLPLLFTTGLWMGSEKLIMWWAWALNQGMSILGLNGVVRAQAMQQLRWNTPVIVVTDIPAASPTSLQWMVGLLIVGVLLVLSFLISPERTPSRYLLRALALCHSSALVFFGVFHAQLPYSLDNHLAAGITMAWMFMLLVPWLHAACFHVFGFGWWRKAMLTILTLVHQVVFVPAQYLFHIALVQTYSLLQLPVLYLLCGVLLNVLVFICLYAWAMSWETVEDAVRH